MNCTRCGKEIAAGQNFCAVCGAPVAIQQTQTQSYQNPAQHGYQQPGQTYQQPYQASYQAPYQPYQQGYQAPYQQPVRQSSPASLILGIVGIIFAWLFALVGHITSIIGIVLGIKEYRQNGKMAGLILSIIGEVCSILSSAIGAAIAAAIF